jgi:CRP-like cAMP-binding protein
MSLAPDPLANHLIAALESSDRQRWQYHLEPVHLKRGEVLYAAGQPLFQAYFPTSAVVSLLQITEAGGSTACAITGNEGVIGISVLPGSDATTSGGSVLISGQAFRIPALVFQEGFKRFDSVRQLLLRYTQTLITQIAQSVVFSRHHTADQRVCTWLLYCLDRLGNNEVVLTHDVIAN